MATALVLSCEHGGNAVPARWRSIFAEHRALLETHRGYDIGAVGVARGMATALRVPLVAAKVTRLLVDTNRSVHHPRLHAPWVRELPADEKARIVAEHWQPHRRGIEGEIERACRKRSCLHVAVHSFTPELDGEVRDFEIGLLYDPARPRERDAVRAWQQALRAAAPELRVRRNAPYRGVSDGLPTAMRRRFPDERYAGIELELNQAYIASGRQLKAQIELLSRTLAAVCRALT